MPMKPEIARYIARNLAAMKEKEREAFDRLRKQTLEESAQEISSVCRSAAVILAEQPDRARVLAFEEPPHPTYFEIMKRLRAAYRNAK